MAKYQQYNEYKDSEVGLLGRIPFGWKVLRYKNILKIMQGMAFKSSEYVDNSNVVNIRMGNIKKGGHIDLKHNTKYLPEKYKDIYSEYKLCEGDAIIAMTDMSPSLEFLAVPAILEGLDLNTIYLLNQRVGKLILDKEFDIRFVRYWLLSDELRGQLKAKGLGTVQANMSNDDLYGSYFFCPSSNERVKIVNFLDHETAQIDTLIEKQQILIQLLKEKRQAVISHAVTKGLNPDAPMKDSGVEWLGEVPSNWLVLRFKHILKIMQGMAFKSSEYVDVSSVVNIRMGNIKKGGYIDLEHNTKYLPEVFKDIYSRYQLNEGDAIIAMTDMSPTLDFLAVPAILEGLDKSFVYLLNQRVGKIIPNKGFDIHFIKYWLLSTELRMQLKLKGLGTVQSNMSNDDLYNSYFFCPPPSERINIVEFLNHEIKKIDTLLNKQGQLVELLQERRTALISAAVTGKIDVRGWVAPDVDNLK